MSLLDSLRTIFRLALVAVLLTVAEAAPNLLAGGAPERALLGSPTLAPQPRLPNFARIPLYFEANQGQTDPQVQYLARGPGCTLFLTSMEAVLALRSRPKSDRTLQLRSSRSRGVEVALPADLRSGGTSEGIAVRMQLVASNPSAQAAGVDRLPGLANYFLGNDPSKWRTRIPTYARVQYKDVYPGIDLVYYGSQRQLEYDFVVSPGAAPSQIRLRFAGAQSVSVDDAGDLVVQVGGQVLVQHPAFVYQQVNGERREVKAAFLVQGQEVAFALGSYDRRQPLIIDPVLSYSTYLGGSGGEYGLGLAVDAAGNTYVTGQTSSVDFPTANPIQPHLGSSGAANAFVAQLTPDGSSLVYSTYLGGSVGEMGWAIALDAAGNAYVTGTTGSPDFPTVNAWQPVYGGDGDAFVAKLSADGSALVYSTYLGGSDNDVGGIARGIAVDPAGNAYVVGTTRSDDFPTFNPLQPDLRGPSDAFVAKFTPDGSVVFSTYVGGTSDDQGRGITVDGAGNAYVTGVSFSSDFPTANPLQSVNRVASGGGGNAFVAKLTPDGSALVYSTYLGGSIGEGGNGIAVDAAGNAYVTGVTSSPDFPTANPLQSALRGGGNAFVAKLTADGSALVYSTYLGGGGDQATRIALDAAGNAYVTGYTGSPNFPTVDPLQHIFGGGVRDAFVAELSADGSALVYSTFLGGSGSLDLGWGIAVDGAGNIYVTGNTDSPDFPTANALQPTLRGMETAFVAKMGTAVTPGPATQFQVSVPAQVTSGTPFDITATALDANGLTAVGYQGTVTFSTTDTDSGVTLPGTYTFTAADQGVHTFSGGCTLITAGQQTVTAMDTATATITGTATVTVTGP